MIKKLLLIFVGLFFFFGSVWATDIEEMESPKGGTWTGGYSGREKRHEPLRRPNYKKAKGRIEFYRKFSILTTKGGALTVKVGDREFEIDELKPHEKEELWNQCNADQKKELRSMYTYLHSAKGDWGKDLYLRMDTYYGAVNEWAAMRKEWTRRETVSALPDAGIKFINELDLFLKVHKDKLKPEHIDKLKIQREEIKNFTTLIASFKVFRKRIQIQGLAKLNIIVISDFAVGILDGVVARGVISTHHALLVQAIETVTQYDEAQSKGKIDIDEFVGILNDRIAALEETLGITIKTYKKMWLDMLEEEKEEEALDATGKYYNCLRACCKKMGGEWMTREESRKLTQEKFDAWLAANPDLSRKERIAADFNRGSNMTCFYSPVPMTKPYPDKRGCHFDRGKKKKYKTDFSGENCPCTRLCDDQAADDAMKEYMMEKNKGVK